MFHIQKDRLLYNNKDMTSLHSPPLELLILLYQRFFGMRRVALRSLLKSLDSTVIPVEILPRWYNSCVFTVDVWVWLPGSGSSGANGTWVSNLFNNGWRRLCFLISSGKTHWLLLSGWSLHLIKYLY